MVMVQRHPPHSICHVPTKVSRVSGFACTTRGGGTGAVLASRGQARKRARNNAGHNRDRSRVVFMVAFPDAEGGLFLTLRNRSRQWSVDPFKGRMRRLFRSETMPANVMPKRFKRSFRRRKCVRQ